MEEESPLVREDDAKPSPSKSSGDIISDSCRLYFKGLIKEETTRVLAGFGVAICDKDNNLLFQMKGSLDDSTITVLEAELMALKRGLTEAVSLGLTHISIFCDDQPIFELVMGISAPEQNNITLLMDDVQRIRQQLTSTILVMVTEDETKFAYELAMETVVSEISISMPPAEKKTCRICFDDEFEDHQMFSVALCGHQFCVECVKRYINVGLMEGSVLRCPYDQCESKLKFRACANLLTPKLRELWERRIEEESISVSDRVYCPNPRCSALMSETKLSRTSEEDGSMRCCTKCCKTFCVKCKVPWHDDLSCEDYKRLGPNPTENDIKLRALANEKMWRQCGRCQHMIERSEGCSRVTCRCRYSFCYKCGAQWKGWGCRHQVLSPLDGDHRTWWIYSLVLFGLLLIFILDFFTHPEPGIVLKYFSETLTPKGIFGVLWSRKDTSMFKGTYDV